MEIDGCRRFKICAFLPREPTWVLVADDKPEYLPFGAKIICEKELIKRQLLRMREDLTINRLDESVEQNH